MFKNFQSLVTWYVLWLDWPFYTIVQLQSKYRHYIQERAGNIYFKSRCSPKKYATYETYNMLKYVFYRLHVHTKVLSCQPRLTVTTCFVYKVIRDL